MDFESASPITNSRERRDQIKKEIEKLGKELPFKFEKISQLRILKAICTYLSKEKHFEYLKKFCDQINLKNHSPKDLYDLYMNFFNKTYINEILSGFVVCFTNEGKLVYLSDNVNEYFGFNAMDVLFAYDNINEIACKEDIKVYDELCKNFMTYAYPNNFSFYSSWFVSKIQKKHIFMSEYKQFKMTGHYDQITQMFVVNCIPVLSVNNRDILISSDPNCFTTVHKLNLQFVECPKNFHELLGYDSSDHQDGFNLYNILSNDSIDSVVKRHKDLLVIKNTRGNLETVKLIHKDGSYVDDLINIYYDPKGFIVCVHQIMKPDEMENYKTYMAKIDKKDQLDSSISSEEDQYALESSQTEDDLFSNIKLENSFEHEYETKVNRPVKTKYVDTEENEFSNKRFKYYNEQQCSYSQSTYTQEDFCFDDNLKKAKEIMSIEESLKQIFYYNENNNESRQYFEGKSINYNETSNLLGFEQDNELYQDLLQLQNNSENSSNGFLEFEDKKIEREDLENFQYTNEPVALFDYPLHGKCYNLNQNEPNYYYNESGYDYNQAYMQMNMNQMQILPSNYHCVDNYYN